MLATSCINQQLVFDPFVCLIADPMFPNFFYYHFLKADMALNYYVKLLLNYQIAYYLCACVFSDNKLRLFARSSSCLYKSSTLYV